MDRRRFVQEHIERPELRQQYPGYKQRLDAVNRMFEQQRDAGAPEADETVLTGTLAPDEDDNGTETENP